MATIWFKPLRFMCVAGVGNKQKKSHGICVALLHTHIPSHTRRFTHTLLLPTLSTVLATLSRALFVFLHKYFESNTFLSGFYQFKPDWGWRQPDKEWVMREANAQCFVGKNIVVVFVCSWLATNSFPATITVTFAYARMQHTHTDSVYHYTIVY